MKKKTLKSIACAAVMALVLSVTACGGSDDAANTDGTDAESTEDAGAEAEPETEDAGTEAEAGDSDTTADTAADAAADTEADASADSGEASYATLEDYYNDPTVKSLVDASFGDMSQEGMTISIEAKGNVLTMTCQFADSSVATDENKAALSAALDQSASSFETIVASFDTAIGQEAGTCTYIVRYTDPDDNVLVEKEFKAQ